MVKLHAAFCESSSTCDASRQAARVDGRVRGAQSCAVDHSTSHKVKEND